MSEHPLEVLRDYERAVARSALKPTERLVALVYFSFTNPEGECWPSDRTLAEHTGLARSSHKAIRRRIIDAGLLERVPYGHGRTNLYRIVLSPTLLGEDDAEATTGSTQPVVGAPQDGVNRGSAQPAVETARIATTGHPAPRSTGQRARRLRADATPQKGQRSTQGKGQSGVRDVVAPAAPKEPFEFDLEAFKDMRREVADRETAR